MRTETTSLTPISARRLWEKYLTAAEYNKIQWKLLNPSHPADGTSPSDPAFLLTFIPTLAANKMADGTLATWEKIQAGGTKSASLGALLAIGAGRLAQLIPELAVEFTANKSGLNHINKGFIKHHFTENASLGQISALINMSFNRDAQCHTHTNYQGNGLPLALQNAIFKELFAADGISGDPLYSGTAITPMNKSKAVYAKLSLLYLQLHDSLTLCNYTLPGWASPLKSRNYRGDADMDAKMYSAVTGETVTRKQLEDMGLRILNLFRALNALYMNEKDQRNRHDIIPEWAFHPKPGNSLPGPRRYGVGKRHAVCGVRLGQGDRDADPGNVREIEHEGRGRHAGGKRVAALNETEQKEVPDFSRGFFFSMT